MPVLKSTGDGSSSSSSSSTSAAKDSSEGRIIGYNRSGSGSISLSNYGSVSTALKSLSEKKATRSGQKAASSAMMSSKSSGSPKHTKGGGERVSFYGANAAAAHDDDEDTNTKSHHHKDKYKQPARHHSPHRPHSHQHPHHSHHHRVPSGAASSSSAPLLAAQTCSSSSFTFDDEEAGDGGGDAASTSKQQQQHSPSDVTNITKIQSRLLRRIALQLSLYVNIIILVTKLIAYVRTLSLSVLAALVDSILDVVSQIVLNYTEKHSSMQRSSALYPAGASRLEPVGVLTCAALMGMASFEVLKEAVENLIEHHNHFFDDSNDADDSDNDMSSFWSMALIVAVKLGLLLLCKKAAEDRTATTSATSTVSTASSSNNTNVNTNSTAIQMSDPTLDALAQDHLNDALSNAVAAAALLCALSYPSLWFLDPIGAILISLYIIFSWYATGKEQIEQLTGKSAPSEFIDELYEIANNFDTRMVVDVIRAYHFGPKFLVELEVVLPRDTLLFESHDLGMELQYEIEGREEVERCFVHIDYESRPYDEHVVSKVPELRAKYRKSASSCHSV